MLREKFCNPVPFSDGKRHTNPDPFVMRWCGRYYCYATDEAGVKVSVSEDMVHWDYRGYAIREKEYQCYWAPSVIYINGLFYMYYSNIPIEEKDCHEEHLKLAVSEDPFGPFVYQKTFFEKFSIDSHPVMRDGELYMFYSVNDWLGLEKKMTGTCILVDKMISPKEFAGKPKAVVLPSLPQEMYEENRFGDGRDWYTIEGASPVFHGGRCFMLYSANAFENVDYFVGTAVAEIKRNLLEMKWEKYPNAYTWMPLLKKNDVVEGTGHNTVTKAPNLFEDWIVYHGRDIEEGLHQGVEQRNMRIDPLLYFQDRMFCPGPSYEKRQAPGVGYFMDREIQAEEKVFFAEAREFYRAEIWCSAVSCHAGAKYMLYLDYQDDENYIALEMHSGIRKAGAICCRKGISVKICSMDLPKEYCFDVPHLIGAERKKNRFRITLDEDRSMECKAEILDGGRNGKIGAGGCFTPLKIHSAAAAEGTELYGEELLLMSEFYAIGEPEGFGTAEITHGELRGFGDRLHLAGREICSGTESFTWRTVQSEGSVELYLGEEKLCSVAAKGDEMTCYLYRGDNMVYLLTDGKAVEQVNMELTIVSGISAMSAAYKGQARVTLDAKGLALQEYAYYRAEM